MSRAALVLCHVLIFGFSQSAGTRWRPVRIEEDSPPIIAIFIPVRPLKNWLQNSSGEPSTL